jgi:hypothetical protein
LEPLLIEPIAQTYHPGPSANTTLPTSNSPSGSLLDWKRLADSFNYEEIWTSTCETQSWMAVNPNILKNAP